jgi:threonine dehydrogenase-like Zn-dependent dehydrogenase
MGHEYCGIVEEVGRGVSSIKPGQFVIGSFAASDNICPPCKAGYQTSCAHREWITGAQAPFLRVPLAEGTLVASPDSGSYDVPLNLYTVRLLCSALTLAVITRSLTPFVAPGPKTYVSAMGAPPRNSETH